VRLELIVDALGASFRNRTCQAFAMLLAQLEDGLQVADSAERDAGLIEQARRIEYFVITAYTQVRTHACLLGHGEAEQLLEATLQEEAVAHVQLMALGRGFSWMTNLPAA
jgi:ferritin-like metal-binding protein YciE